MSDMTRWMFKGRHSVAVVGLLINCLEGIQILKLCSRRTSRSMDSAASHDFLKATIQRIF